MKWFSLAVLEYGHDDRLLGISVIMRTGLHSFGAVAHPSNGKTTFGLRSR